MKGDFTRMTFDPSKHYSRVFEQQGRVQVDSDWNEMNDIHRYFLRRLAADLIGRHGGPGGAFLISGAKDKDNKDVLRDFDVASGRYYVDGWPCENDVAARFSSQRGSPLTSDHLENGKSYLAYLDVWERHITAYEDEDENTVGIREVALRGPDTATRAQVVWQVKCREIDNATINKVGDADPEKGYQNFRDFLAELGIGSGTLRARAIKPHEEDEPCLISPESRYRGAENQLYRVEIHHSGIGIPAGDLSNAKIDITKVATFKWSRENGSAIFPVTRIDGHTVSVRDLGRDNRFGLHDDDWIEVLNDDYILQNRAEPLLQVKKVDRDSMHVTLKNAVSNTIDDDPSKHPYIRRWDLRDRELPQGAIPVVHGNGNDDDAWITLEDGVQIQFPGTGTAGQPGTSPTNRIDTSRPAAEAAPFFRTGDYWLIPARVATGDVDWPGPVGDPLARPPYGVEHSYAPLGVVAIDNNGKLTLSKDLRRTIKQLWLP